MTEEEITIPLVSAGVLVSPGLVGCCRYHAIPVIMLTIVIGCMMMQVIVQIDT